MVLDDGTSFEAGDVVVAGDPETALRLAGAERAPELARSIAALVPVRAACLDLALSRLPRPDRNFALGLDRPLYLSVHSAAAALAPPGGALIQVARYLAPGEPAPRDAMRDALEGWADVVQPGWRDVVGAPAPDAGHDREPRPAVVSRAASRAARGGDPRALAGGRLGGRSRSPRRRRGGERRLRSPRDREAGRRPGRWLDRGRPPHRPPTTPQLYREHGDFLRGYCYRLTGSVADAHDLVQEAFVRAIERPPRDTGTTWRPWLVRVATNLWRDRRRRERREYVGSWLPAPIDTATESWWSSGLGGDAFARYQAAESVTFAFLLALETLTPRERAVLLLRDVYDYSTRECAEALELSEPNVKTTLHRARRALAEYDRDRNPPTDRLRAETASALERLLSCFATRDAGAMAALLASDVEAISDGGGRFYAARKPVRGRDKVALFFSSIARESDAGAGALRAPRLERPARSDDRARRDAGPLRAPLHVQRRARLATV